MNRNDCNLNIEQRIEYWREKRALKMAARLQLHSNRPRTISSSVLGCGSHRKQFTVPPSNDRQHNEGPKYKGVDQKWNSNHIYSGFREHNLLHRPYPAEQRGNGLFHQNRKEKIHFSSQKSLYNERKSIVKTNRKHSSCSDINNYAFEAENQNILHLLESCMPVDCCSAGDLETNIRSSVSVPSTGLCESFLPEPYISDSSCGKVAETIGDDQMIYSNVELSGNKLSESHADFVTVKSNIALNLDVHDNVFPEPSIESHEYMFSVIADKELSAVISVENSEESLASEQQMGMDAQCPTLSFEEMCKEANDASETVLHVNEILEPLASYETYGNGAIADKSLKSVLSLSSELKAEIVVEDLTVGSTVSADSASELNAEVAVDSECTIKSTYEGIEESSGGTIDIESEPLVLIDTSNTKTEASTLKADKNDTTKEIENIENKLANMIIVHKVDVCNNTECVTPMKRERRNALLDATNILQSSTIKYAVREVRKNDEIEAIVTPVRRSLRISSVTPIPDKNMCIQTLEELPLELIQKMKFVPNPAINIPPD